ncbi:hypothetical protein NBRC116599_08400 [Aquicoccus sp. SU-CL01552]
MEPQVPVRLAVVEVVLLHPCRQALCWPLVAFLVLPEGFVHWAC